MDKEKLLQKVDEVLEKEGKSRDRLSVDELFEEFILPSLENSKATLSELHVFEPKRGRGIFSKIKEAVIRKVRNITINTVERESMRQQKFNDVVYQSIKLLLEENRSLREKLSEHTK